MRKIKIWVLSLFVVVFAVQCSPDPKAKIKGLEKQMSAKDFKFDDKGMLAANDLINAYVAYADTIKDPVQSPAYMFEAANLAMNLNESQEALKLFNRIIYQYPDYKKAPDCLFLMGYIYDNSLQNYGKAKEIYEEFLAKYPTHDFADDARVSLDNLGKPLDELVKEFEAKNQQQQPQQN
jgi:tetratricopeptide (TPR) repeat protein